MDNNNNIKMSPALELVVKLQSQIKDLQLENLEYRQKVIELEGVIADQALLLKHMQIPFEEYLDEE